MAVFASGINSENNRIPWIGSEACRDFPEITMLQ
jgi:hypothetical protein